MLIGLIDLIVRFYYVPRALSDAESTSIFRFLHLFRLSFCVDSVISWTSLILSRSVRVAFPLPSSIEITLMREREKEEL